MYLYIKALHIIFVITWFAGLFYIIRLFIYHTEATEMKKDARDVLVNQFILMEKRLWDIIIAPSMILTTATGIYLTIASRYYMANWMQLKLLFVVCLLVYHFLSLNILKQLGNEVFQYSSTQLRMWNEVSTLLLFAIVFLVVLKSMLNMAWALGGLVLLGVVFFIIVKLYKKHRSIQ